MGDDFGAWIRELLASCRLGICSVWGSMGRFPWSILFSKILQALLFDSSFLDVVFPLLSSNGVATTNIINSKLLYYILALWVVHDSSHPLYLTTFCVLISILQIE